jgi:hypothetical protein
VTERVFCSSCARPIERKDPDEISSEEEADDGTVVRRRFCTLSCAGSYIAGQGLSTVASTKARGDKTSNAGLGQILLGVLLQGAHILGSPGQQCLRCKKVIDKTGSCECVDTTKGRKKN